MFFKNVKFKKKIHMESKNSISSLEIKKDMLPYYLWDNIFLAICE